MSIVHKIKDELSNRSQKALGLDGIRYNLQLVLEKLERLYQIEGKLAQLEANSAKTNDQFQNLKTFLTWYSNRVEPWFWTGDFSLNDPEEELAGLLFNFLPGRFLLEVGSKAESFGKAAAAIGFEVLSVESPSKIESLASSNALPATVDFLRIAGEYFDRGVVEFVNHMRPAVVQTDFISDGFQPIRDPSQPAVPLLPTEIMSEMRAREYYWNVLIFRTEAEGFIRMATNLASVPSQTWGSLLFFRDHQLFLKAFHWCKTTLPRFRAAPLAR